MLVFRSISRNDREILGNHADNPGPEGRRVFPLRFSPKLVDHPRGNDALFRANRKHILTRLREYCSFVNMLGSFLMAHCDQKCVRKEIPRLGFLDVSR
jgi:hypothetical protein